MTQWDLNDHYDQESEQHAMVGEYSLCVVNLQYCKAEPHCQNLDLTYDMTHSQCAEHLDQTKPQQFKPTTNARAPDVIVLQQLQQQLPE